MELAKEIARDAINLGACKTIHSRLLNAKTKKDLIEIYSDEIDFCMAKDFPKKEFIKEHFKGSIEEHNIYVDFYATLLNPEKMIVLGKSEGQILFDGYATGRIFATHNADLIVRVKDNSFVMIDMYGDANMTISATEDAKVCINRYGNSKIDAVTRGKAVIKVIDKEKKPY